MYSFVHQKLKLANIVAMITFVNLSIYFFLKTKIKLFKNKADNSIIKLVNFSAVQCSAVQ